jgi:hypothetical protein
MKTNKIVPLLACIALLTDGISSCKICRECTEYDIYDVVTDQEEYCTGTKRDADTWEFNWKSSRAANNRRIVCEEK